MRLSSFGDCSTRACDWQSAGHDQLRCEQDRKEVGAKENGYNVADDVVGSGKANFNRTPGENVHGKRVQTVDKGRSLLFKPSHRCIFTEHCIMRLRSTIVARGESRMWRRPPDFRCLSQRRSSRSVQGASRYLNSIE